MEEGFKGIICVIVIVIFFIGFMKIVGEIKNADWDAINKEMEERRKAREVSVPVQTANGTTVNVTIQIDNIEQIENVDISQMVKDALKDSDIEIVDIDVDNIENIEEMNVDTLTE